MSLLVLVVATGLADRRLFARTPVVQEPWTEPDVCEEAVRIDVLAVHATRGEPHVDLLLRGLGRHLALTQYQSFSVVEQGSADLEDGEGERFRFGLRTLRVQLLDHTFTAARVRLKLYDEDGKRVVIDTTVSVHRNKMFLVAGPKLVGEGVLILPITATW